MEALKKGWSQDYTPVVKDWGIAYLDSFMQ